MGPNMGWKTIVGTIMATIGAAIQSLPGELSGPIAIIATLLTSIGILLGGIGLRSHQAKVEDKIDRVLVIESKVDKALKDAKG